jgi:hypothetical protein
MSMQLQFVCVCIQRDRWDARYRYLATVRAVTCSAHALNATATGAGSKFKKQGTAFYTLYTCTKQNIRNVEILGSDF